MRALEKQVHLGEISYSRMIEIINDKADTLLSDKLLLAYCEIDELTKEVERLRKGIDWTRAEYIKCVNDSDEITEKLEELLTTH